MALRFNSIDDRNRSLNQTICSLNGEPIYCLSRPHRDQLLPALTETQIYYVKLGDPRWTYFVTDYTTDAFSYAPLVLGYVNHETCGAAYVYRQPSRRTTVGISPTSVYSLHDMYRFADYYNNKSAVDMFVNKYPTFKEAATELRDRDTIDAVAFGKHLALKRLGRGGRATLIHRDRPIGMLMHNSFKAVLFKDLDICLNRLMLDEHGVDYDVEH